MLNIPKKVSKRISTNFNKYVKILELAKQKDVNESDTVKVIRDILCDVIGYDKYLDITSEYEVKGKYCVLDNDFAVMAGLIVMDPIGTVKDRNFHRFMAEAGDVEIGGTNYPRLQILNVLQILKGKRFDTPGAIGRGLKTSKISLKV